MPKKHTYQPGRPVSRSGAPHLITILLFAFFAYVFWAFFLPLETEDVWWHLATGRWIFENGRFPVVDVFSPVSPPSPWILTQAGGSCLLYSVFSLAGATGLVIFRSMVFCAVFGLFLCKARNRVPCAWLVLFLVLIAVEIALMRVHLRPYIFNLLFAQLYLLILSDHQEGRPRHVVWLIPFLSAVWFNFHYGAVVYGSLLVVIFMISAFAGARRAQGGGLPPGPGVYFLLFAAHVAAFVANPLGLSGAFYPFKALFDQSFIVRRLIVDNIGELAPPYFLLSPGAWPYHALFALTVFALIKTKMHRFRNTLLVVCASGLFLYGARAADFWLVCCLYVLADAARDNRLVERWQARAHHARTDALVAVLAVAVMAVRAHGLWEKEIYAGGRLVPFKLAAVDPYNPERSLKFLEGLAITGTVFNWDAYGGYMLWKYYPRLRPFSDGRQADPGLYEAYLQATANPARHWPRLEKDYNIAIALLNGGNFTNHRVLDYLLARPDWQLINVDGNAVTLIKRGVFSLPRPVLEFEERLAGLRVRPEDVKPVDAARGGNDNTIYIEDLQEGRIYFSSGFSAYGLQKFRRAYEETGSAAAARTLNQAIAIYKNAGGSR